LLGLAAPAARAQGAAAVPVGDAAYADVDRLAELGALEVAIIGQRPYSRREMARLVHGARARVAAAREGGARWAVLADAPLRRLEARFGEQRAEPAPPSLRLVDRASLTVTSTDARRRGFSGSITRDLEATIDPLAERRLGTPAVTGQTVALELAHRVDATPWLSLHVTERAEARDARSPSTAGRMAAELLLGGAQMRFRNLVLRVGRDQTAWAQHAGDGLFLASDAPAMDLVALGGDEPFLLPAILRRLGPAQATLLVADLGPSVVRSHSKLLAYKVSVQPARSVELGATFMNHYGGQGGRASSLGDRLVDFLPFVDIFRRHNYTDTTRALDVDSDKLLGVDGRARLGALVLTTELLIDDFDVHRMRTMFTWDGAQSVGLALPSVAGSPLSVRIAAKHTGVRTYTHGSLSDGITTRGRLLGDELGPDAKAFGAELGWHAEGWPRLALEGRQAVYSRADYIGDQQGSTLLIRRLGPASNELRDRVRATMLADLREGLTLEVRAGGERIRNDAFTGRTRRQYAAELGLQLAP
jgi:hypothetical protein